ncbi:type III-B CRISPR module-associated Cmr3 family protein [Actinophytocola sp. KF-1]
MLRGAYAAAWIRRHGIDVTTSPEFSAVFEGTGTFGPLHTDTSLPLPLSVFRHKYQPSPRCERLWWDRALGAAETECPHCRQLLEPGRGEPIGEIPRVHRTRAALDMDGVARTAQLFQTSALPTGTQLHGWVTGPAVRALRLGDSTISRLKFGGDRSTHGAVTITVDDDMPTPLETSVSEGSVMVVLRLAAPGVFLDQYGLPADRPDTDELREHLGCADAEIVGAWTRWTEVGGWHAASGLPKPRDRAVAAGSTYQVRCGTAPAPDALTALRARGVGLRRREGFGALYVPPSPPLPDRYWFRRAIPVRGFHGWPRLRVLLRTRLDTWPPEPDADARLLTVLGKHLDDRQREALETFLSIGDQTTSGAVLDMLEEQ